MSEMVPGGSSEPQRNRLLHNAPQTIRPVFVFFFFFLLPQEASIWECQMVRPEIRAGCESPSFPCGSQEVGEYLSGFFFFFSRVHIFIFFLVNW